MTDIAARRDLDPSEVTDRLEQALADLSRPVWLTGHELDVFISE